MSQEKVDRYKAEKANRKQIIRKQKMMNIVRKSVLCVLALALVGWLGFSAYGTYRDSLPRNVVEINYDAVNSYLDAL